MPLKTRIFFFCFLYIYLYLQMRSARAGPPVRVFKKWTGGGKRRVLKKIASGVCFSWGPGWVEDWFYDNSSWHSSK